MARKTAKTTESQAEEPKAETHRYLSPTGEIHELTDDEFLGNYELRGFVRAGDVVQDHLEDVEPAGEPDVTAGEIKSPETNLEPQAPKSDEPDADERPGPSASENQGSDGQ